MKLAPVVFLALATLLGACGSDSEEPTAAGSPGSSTSETPEAPGGEPEADGAMVGTAIVEVDGSELQFVGSCDKNESAGFVSVSADGIDEEANPIRLEVLLSGGNGGATVYEGKTGEPLGESILTSVQAESPAFSGSGVEVSMRFTDGEAGAAAKDGSLYVVCG